MASAPRKLMAAIGRNALIWFGALVALSCIASTYTYVRMSESQHQFTDRVRDSQFWMAAQFGREVQDLTAKLALFDGSPAAAEVIRTKLDVAIGRTGLLKQSDVEPKLDDETSAMLTAVAQGLEAMQPRIAALESGGPALARALAIDAGQLAGGAVRVMLRSHQLDGDNRTALTASLKDANEAFLIALLFLLASFFLILRSVLSQARRLDHTGAALRQALTRAEAGVRAKAAFLATMSHEIRTPMNGVLGAASLLSRTALDQGQRRAVEIVISCGEALMAQLDDVLDFSALEADRVELHPELCEVRSFAQRTCEMMEPAAAQGGVDLALVIDPDVPATLVFDFRRLRQVMLNLLSNACKFTESGGVAVRVSVRRAKGAAWLRVAVIDTGAGMTRAGRRRIFEEFSRLESEAAAGVRGTGLGLAICSRLIAKMDGRLAAVSTPGKGSIFIFRVPVQVGSAVAAAAEAPPLRQGAAIVTGGAACIRRALAQNLAALGYRGAAPGDAVALVLASAEVPDAALPPARRVLRFGRGNQAGLSQRLQGLLCDASLRAALTGPPGAAAVPTTAQAPRMLRMLVADDDPVNREIAASLLNFAGHAVVTVAGGGAAEEELRGGGFDCALVDRHMPDFNGEHVARAVRAMAAPLCHIALISVTADAGAEARTSLLAAGFDDVLIKPVTLEQLTAAIDAALGRAQEKAAPPINAAIRRDLAARMRPGSLLQVIRTFWEQVPGVLAALAPDTGRNPDRPLHALTGSAASLGYSDAAEAARYCRERIGHDNYAEAVAALVMALAGTLERETAELPAAVREHSRLALRRVSPASARGG